MNNVHRINIKRVAKLEKYSAEDDLFREKLCPVVQSFTPEHFDLAGEELPVSRIGVNMIGSSGLGGSFDNGPPDSDSGLAAVGATTA